MKKYKDLDIGKIFVENLAILAKECSNLTESERGELAGKWTVEYIGQASIMDIPMPVAQAARVIGIPYWKAHMWAGLHVPCERDETGHLLVMVSDMKKYLHELETRSLDVEHRAKRDETICVAFKNGARLCDLARTHNLSSSRIRDIIDKRARKERFMLEVEKRTIQAETAR